MVYTHKDGERLVLRLSGERIHRAEAFALSTADREFFVSIGDDTLTDRVVRRPIA